MGAPGYYILCPYGHVIGMIEDDLCWGEAEDESSVWKELEKLENSICKVCGKMAKYRFCHYGNINDCLDDKHKLKWNLKEERYILPESFDEEGMNIIKRKNEYVTIINNRYVSLILERLKSAHIILVDLDKVGSVKIPEVEEKVLYNVIKGE